MHRQELKIYSICFSSKNARVPLKEFVHVVCPLGIIDVQRLKAIDRTCVFHTNRAARASCCIRNLTSALLFLRVEIGLALNILLRSTVGRVYDAGG